MFQKCPQGNGVLCLQSLGPEPGRTVPLGSSEDRLEAELVGCASLLSLHFGPRGKATAPFAGEKTEARGLVLFWVEVKLLGFLHMGWVHPVPQAPWGSAEVSVRCWRTWFPLFPSH